MPQDYLTPEEQERRRLVEQQAAGGGDPVEQVTPATGGAGAAPPMPATTAPAEPSVPRTQQTSIPSAVPPPPPPPPPADLSGLGSELGSFASDWLANPNRYLSDLARATREAGEARLKEAGAAGQRNIEQWAAGRGLVGSSYEGEQMVDLTESLGRARADQEAQLLEMLATAESMDRQAAGQFGLDAVRAGDVMGLDRYRALLEALQLGEAQRQFGGTLGISQQQIDLRAQELQQQAELEGRSLDLEEARNLAQQELAREQMGLQERMQQTELGQRESEFARQFNLDEQQFAEQQRQFSAQLAEQMAARLQQGDQFWASLKQEDSHYAIDVGLRQKALELQQQGMQMDEAFRQASLAQERELTQAAQRLQEQGMEREDAYRYAALEQDETFRREANRLTELGLMQDQAYRYAELAYRESQLTQQESQFARELDFRLAQATSDQERFDAMMKLWEKYFGGAGGGGGGGGDGEGDGEGGIGGGDQPPITGRPPWDNPPTIPR